KKETVSCRKLTPHLWRKAALYQVDMRHSVGDIKKLCTIIKDEMSIKFRIILLALQVLILSFATYLVTGQFAVNEVWYFSGLLAIVINPLLLEPWYPKSYDTLANSIIAILLCFVVSPNVAIVGWTFLKVCLAILIITSI